MTFDLCIATYNSQKWLAECVKALAAVSYSTKKLHLFFADNASTDETLSVLEALQTEYEGRFAGFTILPQEENNGFGAASNAAAHAGRGDMVFFLNPDTEIFPDAFEQLVLAIEAGGEKTGGFELRQFPYEHPKYYNPATLGVGWCSGACFVLHRAVFELTGGFDERFFMYGEDVELSWRIRSLGYKLRYVPKAVVNHYAYAAPGEEKPMQVAGSAAANLALRLKYGTDDDVQWWLDWYETEESRLFEIPGVKPLLRQLLKRVKKHRRSFRSFYANNIETNCVFAPKFLGLDYEFARAGAFYKNRLPKTQPRFSVLVRTHARPELLAITLQSLCWQTYTHFEVVVVEDGDTPISAETVNAFQDRLSIRYIAAQKQVGRCVAGNMAIETARHEYLCFLDDDDYFYPEHLEVMACLIEGSPAARLFVAGSVEAACEPLNRRGTRWKVTEKTNISHDKISFATLCYGNPFPIQAAVFHRSLVEDAGVLAPEMDAFEDWDLWMRYGMHTPVAAVSKATSLYKIPADEKEFARRDKIMAHYRKLLYERAAKYTASVSAQDILSLVYTPEKAQELEDAGQHILDYIAYKQGLRKTAQEIYASRTWRFTKPLRALPRGLAWLFAALHGGTGRLASGAARFADWVGPVKPDFSKEDPAALNAFIFGSRRSVSWRLGERLSGKK